MKAFLGFLGIAAMLFTSGCVWGPAYPAGVSVGVYGEYPYAYYGHGYYHPYAYHRWYHPYDRDNYYYRYHTW